MRRKSKNQAITFVEGQYSQHFVITQFPDPASYVSSRYSSFPSPKKPAFVLIVDCSQHCPQLVLQR